MTVNETLSISTHKATQWIDITSSIQQVIERCAIINGTAILFVPHTTAGITINENADPSVVYDIDRSLNQLVPFTDQYTHAEGNSAAHIKSSLIGTQLYLLIQQRRLLLGTWQSVYFCEFDGPRTRQCIIKIMVDSV